MSGSSGDRFDPKRRRVLAGLAATASGIALSGCGGESSGADSADNSALPLPAPENSGIEHIIVVMMENRSFDHYLGWLPGADGKQAGLSYRDQAGNSHVTYPLAPPQAPNYQGCGDQDPDHSHEGGLRQYNGGACDGFLLTSPDTFPIGYYEQKDLSFFGQAAPAWTVFDHYFCAIMAETYPNRFYMHCAQTPVIHNSEATSAQGLKTVSDTPTIWQRLSAAGLSGNYYYSDTPFTALWLGRSGATSKRYSAFLDDCAQGTLPNVAFVDPAFSGEGQGTSKDDHPFADIRDGQAFLSQIYDAVTQSPSWSKTALFITYDEWGGFFDHVAPGEAGVIPDADMAAFEREGITPSSLRGFRVPTLAISPYARRGLVSHGLYDHTSILKMIEWRWNLQPLTARDTAANNIAEAFDFSRPILSAPHFNVPPGPFGSACSSTSLAGGSVAAAKREAHIQEWQTLQALARSQGFDLGSG